MSGFVKGCAVGLSLTGLVGVVGLMVAGPPLPQSELAAASGSEALPDEAVPMEVNPVGAEPDEGTTEEPDGILVSGAEPESQATEETGPGAVDDAAPTLAEAGGVPQDTPQVALSDEAEGPDQPVIVGLADPSRQDAQPQTPTSDPEPVVADVAEEPGAEPTLEPIEEVIVADTDPAPAIDEDPQQIETAELTAAPDGDQITAAAPSVSVELPEFDLQTEVTRSNDAPALAEVAVVGPMDRPDATRQPVSDESPTLLGGPVAPIAIYAEDPMIGEASPGEGVTRPELEAARALVHSAPAGAVQPSDEALPDVAGTGSPGVLVAAEVASLVSPTVIGAAGYLTLEEPVLRTPQSFRPALSLPDQVTFSSDVTANPPEATEDSVEVVLADDPEQEVVEIIPEETTAQADPATPDTQSGDGIEELQLATPGAEPETNAPAPLEEVAATDEPTVLTIGEGSSLVRTQATEDNAGSGPVVRTTPDGENTGFGDLASSVRVLRPGSDTDTGEDAPEAAAAQVDPNAPPLQRFAVAFDGDGDAPLVSVIVIDDESSAISPGDLKGLSYPVAVAIDPLGDAALERMALYRDAGTEVMMLANFPAGSQPGDIEVFFAGFKDILPEAIAVLDTGEVAASRDLMAQLAGAVNEAGLGLVIPGTGINSGVRNAEQAGLPVARIHRDLDGDGQDGTAIRRLLDQAAFRAGQSDGLVLVARLRPETLDALKEWQTTNRGASVTFAPVSRLLLGAP